MKGFKSQFLDVGTPGSAALRCGLGAAGHDRDLPPARGDERGGHRQHAGPLRVDAARACRVQLPGGPAAYKTFGM